MKKLLFVVLAMLCVLPLFGKSYSEYLAEAKKYESQKKWCYALDAYYDAMGTDELPENKLEAYEGYSKLKDAIISGNPGLGKFNEFTIHDEWKNLLIDAEKYGSSISIYDITIGDLYKGALDYETRTATYSTYIVYRLSDRYRKTISIIEEGYEKAYKWDWTDLPKDWPLYSASSKHDSAYNVNGALVYAMGSKSMEYFNAFKWIGKSPSSVRGLGLYDYKFNIVDENGKEIVKGKRWLFGDNNERISFSGITSDVMDLIDSGKAFVNPVGCYLQYGKYNSADDKGGRTFMKNFPEVQLSMDKMVFICWNNETDKIAANFSSTVDYLNYSNALNSTELVSIDDSQMQMLKTEVTQALYKTVMGENPSTFTGWDLPVESVSWYDAICFCNKWSEIKGFTPVYSVNGSTNTSDWNYIPHKGNSIDGSVEQNKLADGFRLPTSEEWGYAAKGGEDYEYAGSDNLYEVGWYDYKGGSKTCPVAQKKANGYGLYDMTGNVWEWCWDNRYSGRVIRGGCWANDNSDCIVNYRKNESPDSASKYRGFRVVRSSSEQIAEKQKNEEALQVAEAENRGKIINNLELVNVNNIQTLKTEVTQALYKAVMGENPSAFMGDDLPVESVSWYDAIYFCNRLSEIKGFTPVYSVNGSTNVADWNYTPHKEESIMSDVEWNENADGFRLPTYGEWEYMARDGEYSVFSLTNDYDHLEEGAWYGGYKTHRVAQKKANEYGLYDMLGNVWEWSWNKSDNDSDSRMILGGSWKTSYHFSVSWGSEFKSHFDYDSYDKTSSSSNTVGFRIVRTIK